MSLALFLDENLAELPAPGATFRLAGDEGRHASVVRRIRAGERVLVADGRGRAVVGRVLAADASGLSIEAEVHRSSPRRPLRFVVVQALAKGDRAELAVEMLTEIGADEIVPWQAARSVVQWHGERGERARARWQRAAREATKQSRRFRVPVVGATVDTRSLVDLVQGADLALVLHEEAAPTLAGVSLPAAGTVVAVVGPEGGIAPEELTALTEAGGRPVTISDGVLRTSTAGVVALAGLLLR